MSPGFISVFYLNIVLSNGTVACVEKYGVYPNRRGDILISTQRFSCDMSFQQYINIKLVGRMIQG